MTKMAAMSTHVYGKTLPKFPSLEPLDRFQNDLAFRDLSMFINHDLVMTLTDLLQGQIKSLKQKTVKISLKRNTSRNIYDSEQNDPRGSSDSRPEPIYTCQTRLLVYRLIYPRSQVSVNRTIGRLVLFVPNIFGFMKNLSKSY